MTANFLLFPLGAYLLGSIPFGYLLVKWAKGLDIRAMGSGNIGMTNVWRVAGAGWGIATLLLDIAKGVLAVGLAIHFCPADEMVIALSGLTALLGNVFSIFLSFTGGKGIGVSTGVFFTLLPLESSVGLGLFVLAVALTRMISAGSLLGVTGMALLAVFNQQLGWRSGLALLAGIMIWWTHRQNVARILAGTENKIGKRKK